MRASIRVLKNRSKGGDVLSSENKDIIDRLVDSIADRASKFRKYMSLVETRKEVLGWLEIKGVDEYLIDMVKQYYDEKIESLRDELKKEIRLEDLIFDVIVTELMRRKNIL